LPNSSKSTKLGEALPDSTFSKYSDRKPCTERLSKYIIGKEIEHSCSSSYYLPNSWTTIRDIPDIWSFSISGIRPDSKFDIRPDILNIQLISVEINWGK